MTFILPLSSIHQNNSEKSEKIKFCDLKILQFILIKLSFREIERRKIHIIVEVINIIYILYIYQIIGKSTEGLLVDSTLINMSLYKYNWFLFKLHI